MSNQMMQFDEPEGQEQEYVFDPDPRYINRDPRERSQQEQQDTPLYGAYTGTGQIGQTYYGEKLRPRPRQAKKRVQWWLPLVVTLLVLLLPMMGYGFASRTFPAPMHDIQQFPMHMKDDGLSHDYQYTVNNAQGRTLIIQANGGVQIHSGDSNSNSLDVQAHTSGFGGPGDRSDLISIDPNLKDQTSNTSSPVTITAQSSSGPFSSVDLDVTVPQGMNVQVVDNSGHIEVNNFTGNVQVDGNSGSISADTVNGQVKLSSQSGSISVENSQLSGDSTLRTESSSINFDGSIAQSGSYTFTSNSGTVNISLPQDTSFHLNTDANPSLVNNDFPSNDVGSTPRPTLTVHTNSGSINIQKR